MNDLIQDTWQDLRDKRLWPVALVLVLAIVAIPVLLTKSAAAPPPEAQVGSVPQPPSERVTVTLAGDDAASSGAGSSLERFSEGDPFTPPSAIAKAVGSSASATLSSSGGAKDGGSAGGKQGGAPDATAPDEPVRVAPPQTRTETAEYEYVADLTFWNGERRRTLRGVRKLDMLPDQSAPVLIFMGTAGDGGNAVFLVDSTLKAAGEGRCVPSDANCAYVHVGPGAEHIFTTEEGDSYRLRVDEIRRVEASAAAARRSAASSSARGGAVRRFELPALVDLIAVTETTTESAAPVVADSPSSVRAGGR